VNALTLLSLSSPRARSQSAISFQLAMFTSAVSNSLILQGLNSWSAP
jgi:hypothetical protein